MNVLHVSLDWCMGLTWEELSYWHDRALEQKTGKEIGFVSDETGKVDDETFKRQLEYMNNKLAEKQKAQEGTISG